MLHFKDRNRKKNNRVDEKSTFDIVILKEEGL